MEAPQNLAKVENAAQNQAEAQMNVNRVYSQKAEKMHAVKGRKLLALKGKNKIVGLTLVGCVLGIYGYTMFSVRQGKMMEAFDKVPE